MYSIHDRPSPNCLHSLGTISATQLNVFFLSLENEQANTKSEKRNRKQNKENSQDTHTLYKNKIRKHNI